MTNTVKDPVLPAEEEIRHPAGRNIHEVTLAGQKEPHPLQIPLRLPATNNMTNEVSGIRNLSLKSAVIQINRYKINGGLLSSISGWFISMDLIFV